MKNRRVVISYIKNHEDNLLYGLRKDTNKWTCAGGHLENNEDPYLGMVRELKEETGLDAKELKLVKVVYDHSQKLMLYLFEVKIDPTQVIDPSNDPDKEADIWEYKDPYFIQDQFHVDKNKNLAFKHWLGN